MRKFLAAMLLVLCITPFWSCGGVAKNEGRNYDTGTTLEMEQNTENASE
ncbi:MAG: hypothetical protein IJX88_02095 [Clostridia bacterium]|nr:hypothetical protein [Clostridia bacterium]